MDLARSIQEVTEKGALLGPSFTNEEIEAFLKEKTAPYTRLNDEILFERLADELSAGKIVGWFQGRMEFGPRAFGCRTILGDARNPTMQSVMNLKIKYRESFRPFAPSVLRERLSDYFEMDADSPYMLLVAPVVESRRIALSEEQQSLWGIDLLNVPRSDIPAATHVDYSARVQTLHKEMNPRYYNLLKVFEAKTGCAGHVMGWINTRVILGIVFYVIVTPIGMLRAWLGKDPMGRRLQPDLQSYHVPRKPRPAAHLKRQY